MKGGHGQQMNQQQQQHREGSAASKRQHVFDVHESMEELARLADTAGLKVGDMHSSHNSLFVLLSLDGVLHICASTCLAILMRS